MIAVASIGAELEETWHGSRFGNIAKLFADTSSVCAVVGYVTISSGHG